jgi:hypothetical protein
MRPPAHSKIIDTPNSISWFDENGILCSVLKNNPELPINEQKKQFEEFRKEQKGKKVCMLIDITDARPVSKQSRELTAKELPGLIIAMAFISRSALGKMLANLFLGLKVPPYPVKVFSSENEAKEWLKQYL